MNSRWAIAILIGFLQASPGFTQAPAWQFRFQAGQTLTYRVEHITKATEMVGSNKFEMRSKLNLVKRWRVESVDAKGIATLHMSLLAMRNEQVRPNGETLLFDSAQPAKNTAGLKEQMSKYVGPTLAILRVDASGKVIEVIKGSAVQYESDPPLVLRLPSRMPSPGQAWERLYKVTLEPPYGVGEKFQGQQRYTVTKVAGDLATIQLTTTLKMPQSAAERMPLLQKQPAGEVIFDLRAGRIQSAELRIDERLQGHQGEGSTYRFESVYREQYVE